MNLQEYFALATLLTFIVLVGIRTISLKKQGIRAVEFGKRDKKDFLIPPFVLFYFYLLIANAFSLPTLPYQELFYSEAISWIGVIACCAGLVFFVWTLLSFKKSFRIGLAENASDGLVTTIAFAVSRNPIYVAFAIVLIGQFLVFPSWLLLIYIFAGLWLFRRQVLLEESFLKNQYGEQFLQYCKEVRRWL